jgi:hypothetical protein
LSNAKVVHLLDVCGGAFRLGDRLLTAGQATAVLRSD